jgi:NAD+ synthase
MTPPRPMIEPDRAMDGEPMHTETAAQRQNGGRASAEGADPLALDLEATADRLAQRIGDAVRTLGRRGVVVAVSGGIDSSVSAALCVRALGPKRVMLLRLPERDILDVGSDSSDLGLELAEALGAPSVEENISAALEGAGCYAWRDEAIRTVFPDYEPTWKHKVVRSAPSGGIIVFSLVVERPDGTREQRRIPSEAYRLIIAATNMKQRIRKLKEYSWADRLHYAVVGTPNRLEYDQGFFVKGGDGLADIKPIAGLYKTQVYALARHFGLPESIAGRRPTTETFSLPQTQEEFYFGHPYERMDLLVWGEQHDVPAAALSPHTGLSADEVEAAYWDIRRKREATAYLHAPAILIEPGEGG